MWFYHVVAFMTVAIWGSTFISTKVLIQSGISPAQVYTLRFLIAYVLMLLFFHKHIFARTWRDELLMAGLGLTGGTVFFLAQNVALGYSTAMNVSLIVCSCPLFTMLLHRIADADLIKAKAFPASCRSAIPEFAHFPVRQIDDLIPSGIKNQEE